VILRSRATRDSQDAAATEQSGEAKTFGGHAPVDKPIEILYEDDAMAVAYKPAGVLITPNRFQPDEDTLTNRFWNYLWQKTGKDEKALYECRPRLVHRLDKDTSGAIIFAKTLEAQRLLTEQFEKGRIIKTYLAVCDGKIEKTSDRIEYSIGAPPKVTHATRGKMFIGTPYAQEAVTDIKVLEAREKWSLVEAKPRTGRTHQIRLHLSAYGHPLVVDPLYGKRDKFLQSDLTGHKLSGDDKVIIDRMPLHCVSLDFIAVNADRRTSARVRVEAPLAQDIETLLKFLRADGKL